MPEAGLLFIRHFGGRTRQRPDPFIEDIVEREIVLRQTAAQLLERLRCGRQLVRPLG